MARGQIRLLFDHWGQKNGFGLNKKLDPGVIGTLSSNWPNRQNAQDALDKTVGFSGHVGRNLLRERGDKMKNFTIVAITALSLALAAAPAQAGGRYNGSGHGGYHGNGGNHGHNGGGRYYGGNRYYGGGRYCGGYCGSGYYGRGYYGNNDGLAIALGVTGALLGVAAIVDAANQPPAVVYEAPPTVVYQTPPAVVYQAPPAPVFYAPAPPPRVYAPLPIYYAPRR